MLVLILNSTTNSMSMPRHEETNNILDPGPYCPDKGKAQITDCSSGAGLSETLPATR
jgi:hypothetical protein